MSEGQVAAAERIGSALAEAGLQRMPARVWAALLVDDDGRMTSAELASFLHVSPAGISGAVKYLAQLGMVRRERERGTRRDVYVVEDDAWHDTMMRHDQIYGPIRQAFERGQAELADDAPGRHRLLLSLEFLRFLEGELDAVTVKWEQRKRELGY